MSINILAVFDANHAAEASAQELKEHGLTELRIDTVHEDLGQPKSGDPVELTAKGYEFADDPTAPYSSFTSYGRRGLIGGRRILLTVVAPEKDLPLVREIIAKHDGQI